MRVVHHYGSRPEFVVLGGLVPELLCAGSAFQHAGTTDVDVQVDLEIACGAVNLRGTGFAARDFEVRKLSTRIGGVLHDAEVNVAGLAGFLLAKAAAALSRRKPKDWYDIAFVLLHNDAGGPNAAATRVRGQFDSDRVEPIEQLFAKLPTRAGLGKILVRRRDEPNIQGDFASRAQAPYSPLLKEA